MSTICLKNPGLFFKRMQRDALDVEIKALEAKDKEDHGIPYLRDLWGLSRTLKDYLKNFSLEKCSACAEFSTCVERIYQIETAMAAILEGLLQQLDSMQKPVLLTPLFGRVKKSLQECFDAIDDRVENLAWLIDPETKESANQLVNLTAKAVEQFPNWRETDLFD